MENMIGKKVKIWPALIETIGGKYKGLSGIVTEINEEFIVLDKIKYIGRKFIILLEII
jgi:hypothetical protein